MDGGWGTSWELNNINTDLDSTVGSTHLLFVLLHLHPLHCWFRSSRRNKLSKIKFENMSNPQRLPRPARPEERSPFFTFVSLRSFSFKSHFAGSRREYFFKGQKSLCGFFGAFFKNICLVFFGVLFISQNIGCSHSVAGTQSLRLTDSYILLKHIHVDHVQDK